LFVFNFFFILLYNSDKSGFFYLKGATA